jgi:hypothetical protein
MWRAQQLLCHKPRYSLLIPFVMQRKGSLPRRRRSTTHRDYFPRGVESDVVRLVLPVKTTPRENYSSHQDLWCRKARQLRIEGNLKCYIRPPTNNHIFDKELWHRKAPQLRIERSLKCYGASHKQSKFWWRIVMPEGSPIITLLPLRLGARFPRAYILHDKYRPKQVLMPSPVTFIYSSSYI